MHRYTYREAERRARRLASALGGWASRRGDRVGTLAWNGYRHIELYYAVSGMGAVLPHDQPAPVRRADRLHHQPCRGPGAVLRPDLRAAGRATCPGCDHPPLVVVVMTDRAHMPDEPAGRRRPALLRGADRRRGDDDFAWPEFDENTACGAVLHLGHDRQARRACSTATARRCCTPTPSALPDAFGLSRRRRDPAGRADVPRQRLGHALRRAHGRRQAGPARRRTRRRQPARADRARAGDARPPACRRCGSACSTHLRAERRAARRRCSAS